VTLSTETTQALLASAEEGDWHFRRGMHNGDRPWRTPYVAERGRRTLYDSDQRRLLERVAVAKRDGANDVT
jgi:hypothetical protein